MKPLISFLTRIPVKSADIHVVAGQSYLFPVVGLLIGLIAYIASVVSFGLLPEGLGVILVVLMIYFTTGLIHLDGLADFSDGIMASGDRQRKISAMKDISIGTGGIFSVVFVLLLMFNSITLLRSFEADSSVFGHNLPLYGTGCALITSEISAKFSMNTCIALGNEIPGGLGSIFIQQSTKAKYAIAGVMTSLISMILVGYYFFVVFTGVVVALAIVKISHENFGGVNGDVLGAANELSRVATLVVWVIIFYVF